MALKDSLSCFIYKNLNQPDQVFSTSLVRQWLKEVGHEVGTTETVIINGIYTLQRLNYVERVTGEYNSKVKFVFTPEGLSFIKEVLPAYREKEAIGLLMERIRRSEATVLARKKHGPTQPQKASRGVRAKAKAKDEGMDIARYAPAAQLAIESIADIVERNDRLVNGVRSLHSALRQLINNNK